MKICILPLVIMFLLSCTPSIMSFDNGGWVVTGVTENVEKLAGSEAIDCGFHDLLTEKGKGTMLYGIECVRRAILHDRSFMYGINRIPLDSVATEILIRTSDGKYWTIVYDLEFDSDKPQLWVHSCKSVKLHKKSGTYEGKKCIEEPNSKWL